tara:strand:+ start:1517 stop:2188 length:672 start_codon:yes stop_codon:yes gene_type:complete
VKFSKQTFEILKNFSTINSNILVKPGNTLSTITGAKNVMSEAKVPEEFDIEFGIWDLSKFLGTISLFQDPDFEFTEKYVLIRSASGSCVKYYYSEPSLLTVPTKRLDMPDTVVSFVLPDSVFKEILRAASVLQLPDLAIRSKDGAIVAVVLDKTEPTSNDYTIDVGINETGAEFDFHFKIENLKFIPGDYTVNITEKVVSEFVNSGIDVTYWVALESTSNYTG